MLISYPQYTHYLNPQDQCFQRLVVIILSRQLSLCVYLNFKTWHTKDTFFFFFDNPELLFALFFSLSRKTNFFCLILCFQHHPSQPSPMVILILSFVITCCRLFPWVLYLHTYTSTLDHTRTILVINFFHRLFDTSANFPLTTGEIKRAYYGQIQVGSRVSERHKI